MFENVGLEARIHLDKFKFRPYQLPLLRALDKGMLRAIAIWPRRAGKDLTAFNYMIRAALKKVGVYFIVYPTYSQGRKILWDSSTNDGTRFLDFIPQELIRQTNSTEMKIRLINGSLIQIVGSDNYDSLVGTNPRGIIFSEYALQDPRAYQFLRPVLTANFGWAVFISTPRGKNHLYELYNIAVQNPDHWFCSKLTVEDTHHISLQDIERERQSGEMSDDLIQQEYYTSFDLGIEGSYYCKYLDKMRLRGQIGTVPYEYGIKVNTAWDIGVRDSTSIIFFQICGNVIRIIDYYENSKVGLEHYVKVIKEKPYVYGAHIAPHDIKVTEWGSGQTRLEKAAELGILFDVAPDISIQDGIESVRSVFSKVWIDEQSCKQLIKALENYRQEYDTKKRVYKSTPCHDWSSHACFTGDTLILTRRGMYPIMNIRDDDMVLTLNGWKKCGGSWVTRQNAQLVEVKFEDGTTVKCTPDHFFLTVNGWRYAENLEKGMQIQSSLMNSHNTLMDHFIDCGPENDTILRAANGYTGQFGKTLLALFQKIATFTTEIMILPITLYSILNAFLRKITCTKNNQNQKDLVIRQEKPQQNGMDLKQGDCGIKDMQNNVKVGRNGNMTCENASIVEKTINVSLERMDMNKNSAIKTARLPTIESVKPISYRQDVWCLNVPEIGHFSLPNGAVVKNSDAMRYLTISLPMLSEGMSAEELDKAYQRAMYGTSNQLPAPFRDNQSRWY